MKDQATAIADLFRESSSIYQITIYTDGAILTLAVGEKTAGKWFRLLTNASARCPDKVSPPQMGVSSDGLLHAFILRGDPEVWQLIAGGIGDKLDRDGFDKHAMMTDNRHLDDH